MIEFDKNIAFLVNKENLLDACYLPDNLITTDENENNFHNYVNPNNKPQVSSILINDLNKMIADAKKDGLNIAVDSGYRSYEYQQNLWDYYVKEKGLEHTLKYVAPAGASEHQTGLAIDFGAFKNGVFHDELTEDDPELIWLKNNAHNYGFILRYPKGKEIITGYNFEPWHFRYVGIELAKYIHDNDITLEEFYLLNNKTMLK